MILGVGPMAILAAVLTRHEQAEQPDPTTNYWEVSPVDGVNKVRLTIHLNGSTDSGSRGSWLELDRDQIDGLVQGLLSQKAKLV